MAFLIIDERITSLMIKSKKEVIKVRRHQQLTVSLAFMFTAVSCLFSLASCSTTTSQSTYKCNFYFNQALYYSCEVAEGGEAIYEGGTPAKKNDETFFYTFQGWDKPLSPIHDNTDFYAEFASEYINYTVILKKGDQEVKRVTMHHDESFTFDGASLNYSDEYQNYVFQGWEYVQDSSGLKASVVFEGDKISAPSGNYSSPIVYQATFQVVTHAFDVTFYDEDGTFLKQERVEKGQTATPPPDPAKAPDLYFEYSFKGWDQDISLPITEAKEFHAVYAPKERIYTTRFFADDKTTLLYQAQTGYNEIVTYPYEFPAKASSDPALQFTFMDFENEDKSVIYFPLVKYYVAGNVDLYATYKQSDVTYKVTFIYKDKTVEQQVKYGKTPVDPSPSPLYLDKDAQLYRITGYDHSLTEEIYQDTTIQALYVLDMFETYPVIQQGSYVYTKMKHTYSNNSIQGNIDITEAAADSIKTTFNIYQYGKNTIMLKLDECNFTPAVNEAVQTLVYDGMFYAILNQASKISTLKKDISHEVGAATTVDYYYQTNGERIAIALDLVDVSY